MGSCHAILCNRVRITSAAISTEIDIGRSPKPAPNIIPFTPGAGRCSPDDAYCEFAPPNVSILRTIGTGSVTGGGCLARPIRSQYRSISQLGRLWLTPLTL